MRKKRRIISADLLYHLIINYYLVRHICKKITGNHQIHFTSMTIIKSQLKIIGNNYEKKHLRQVEERGKL